MSESQEGGEIERTIIFTEEEQYAFFTDDEWLQKQNIICRATYSIVNHYFSIYAMPH